MQHSFRIICVALKVSKIKVMGILSEEATLFAFLLSMDQLIKERICFSRSKFFPLRVDPILNKYLIQRSKQEFMQVNITFGQEAGGIS